MVCVRHIYTFSYTVVVSHLPRIYTKFCCSWNFSSLCVIFLSFFYPKKKTKSIIKIALTCFVLFVVFFLSITASWPLSLFFSPHSYTVLHLMAKMKFSNYKTKKNPFFHPLNLLIDTKEWGKDEKKNTFFRPVCKQLRPFVIFFLL